MNEPIVTRAGYVVESAPELIVPSEGQSFKPFYAISAINDRNSNDKVVLRVGKKMFDNAKLNEISAEAWTNSDNPVVLNATVAQRIQGVTQYLIKGETEPKFHASTGESVNNISRVSRVITLIEKMKYGLLFNKVKVDDLKAVEAED
jgi:hypothetical protein